MAFGICIVLVTSHNTPDAGWKKIDVKGPVGQLS